MVRPGRTGAAAGTTPGRGAVRGAARLGRGDDAGGQWGVAILLSGLAQGLGAELVFAALRYRSYSLATALLAGAASGLGAAIVDVTVSYVHFGLGWKATYTVACMVGGLVLAGLVSWLIARGLGATGVLSALAGGRRQTRV